MPAVAPPLLVVGAEIFERFGATPMTVPPGFFGDWLGVLTRSDVHSSSEDPAVAEALKGERHGAFPPPTTSELLLDWEPLLEAEELAGPKFTAVALGAGWGRWIVGCAFAAMKRGRDYHIVGVEAEPQHFAWMERHLADNKIAPEKARLINAAVNSYTGTCWFMVGDPTANYGQSVVSDAQYKSAGFQRDLRSMGLQAIAMPCVDLSEVFDGLERVDYLHMDIQGSEADVLLAQPDLLDERVATVNIGTHSKTIERRLRRHFTAQGWLCRYDIEMSSTIMACVEGDEPSPITFGDGVQVWENPRLTGRTDVASFRAPIAPPGRA
jgi:FkbM family methyltransferase